MADTALKQDHAWLPHLTGLRGLAALYVLLCHLLETTMRGHSTRLPHAWYASLLMGHLGVTIFIVLSGYCLLFPLVGRPDFHPKRGWWVWFGQRARRILPTYYLMMGLALVLIQFTGELAFEREESLSRDSIVSHLLLYMNWTENGLTIAGTMWSLATEVQIYLLVPLIMWAWRRLGKIPTILILGPLSFLPHMFANPDYWWSYFHYLLSFLLGGLAADIVHRPRPDFWSRLPWRALSLVSCMVLLSCFTWAERLVFAQSVPLDVAVSVMMAIILVHLGRTPPGQSRLGRVLSSPIPYGLGLMSYSMYLIQQPLLEIAVAHTSRLPWGDDYPSHFMFMLVVVLPAILLCTYVFYQVAERPFLSRGSDFLPLPWPSVRRAVQA